MLASVLSAGAGGGAVRGADGAARGADGGAARRAG